MLKSTYKQTHDFPRFEPDNLLDSNKSSIERLTELVAQNGLNEFIDPAMLLDPHTYIVVEEFHEDFVPRRILYKFKEVKTHRFLTPDERLVWEKDMPKMEIKKRFSFSKR